MKNQYLTNVTNTNLVVWGTNLGSSVGNGRVTKSRAQMYKLTPYHFFIAVGLLLSDGWIEFPSRQSNARLMLEQSFEKFEYLWSTFVELSPYCAGYPLLRHRTSNGKSVYPLRLQTRSLPGFSELYELFIRDGLKIVPDDIYNLLNPVALLDSG